MNEGMEFNGIPVPKVHRPPSMIFRDEGNPSNPWAVPGIYRCVGYGIPKMDDLYYEPTEDCVLQERTGYVEFPRVIVEVITPEAME